MLLLLLCFVLFVQVETGMTVDKVTFITTRQHLRRQEEPYFRLTPSQLSELLSEYEQVCVCVCVARGWGGGGRRRSEIDIRKEKLKLNEGVGGWE